MIGSLRELAGALGGEIVGGQVLAPGPGHNRRDRSLSVKPSATAPLGVICYSFAGDPFDVCQAYVAQRLGLDPEAWRAHQKAQPRVTGGSGRPSLPVGQDDEIAFALAAAKRIVSELGQVLHSPGESYLRDVRKTDTGAIADVLGRVGAIGWHPAVRFNEPDHPLHGRRLGCIVGIMTDAVTAQPTGAISRTYIHDGHKIGKAKTLGRPTGIVRLTPDDEVLGGLCLAEGLESALFAMAKGFRPMWSTGSAGLMRALPIMSGIESLTLFVDHDRPKGGDTIGPGEQAARETEARWRDAGREVRLLRTRAFGDINDSGMRAA